MQVICWLIILVSAFTCPLLTKSEIKPVLINKFDLPHAASTTLRRTWVLNSTSWSLVIACFNPIPGSTDYVYSIENIEWQLTTNITPVALTNQITWPNDVIPADPIVPYSMIVPSGYYIPGKTNGNLYYLNKNQSIPLVPNEKTNWFYHDVAFKDIDMDGHIDIVAGRVNVPLVFGTPQTQLIWLKNPGTVNITGPWKLNFLMHQGGPDINVQFAQVDGKQVEFIDRTSILYIKSISVLGFVC